MTEPGENNIDRQQQEELWFSDGNVVLAATTDSTDNVTVKLFQVHKSQLARHSKVFEDMFNLEEGLEPSSELLQGLPLVHLTDGAGDVKRMLDSIYNPLYVSSHCSLFYLMVSPTRWLKQIHSESIRSGRFHQRGDSTVSYVQEVRNGGRSIRLPEPDTERLAYLAGRMGLI